MGVDQVTGSFTFTRESGELKRGGGACLLADIYNGGYACTGWEDCDAELGRPEGGFNYCVDVNGTGHPRCWARPNAMGCVRSKTYSEDGTIMAGTYSLPTVSAVVNDKLVKWITYGCLASEDDITGCGSTAANPPNVHAVSDVLGFD